MSFVQYPVSGLTFVDIVQYAIYTKSRHQGLDRVLSECTFIYLDILSSIFLHLIVASIHRYTFQTM